MYVPPCDLNGGGCSEWDVTGWTRTEPGTTEIRSPFSGKLWCYCVYILFNYSVSLRNFGNEHCII
jgi:hypothetical protein